MKIAKSDIKKLIIKLGFESLNEDKETFFKNYKQHNDYVIKVNFKNEKIDYGTKIKLGDLTTSNFENSENFVVLECVNRILEKGYSPEKLSLEHNMNLGRREKGKLDILILSKDDDKAYLMIECKTWGDEYKKERNKMLQNGGQLFSYYDKGRASKYLCLYTSRLSNNDIEYVNDIVKVEEHWKELDNDKEVYEHWNKNFKDNGIFEEWTNAYDIEIKALTRGRLKELTEEDSGRIFNQFAEILRHNVVSDKPNAFNKIFNLFLCKIVDEDRKADEELKFQWLETDTDEDLQKRLSDLYKQGMKEYLTKEVTDYNDEQVAEKLYALDPVIRDQIRDMFTRVRLHKNNEFAFKEVFDEKSFRENAIVVREVVELLQPYQIRYGHKQQFLGDFFELLLSTGIKQEAGQFFTPVPIAKFIISSLPIDKLIKNKINSGETNFLPYVIDFAAGSGHFLTETMDEIQNIIENIDPVKQRPSVKARLKSWREAPFEWCYDFIYGIEADYRLVKTAKVSCFLNGDGLANVIHADGLDHFQKSIDYKGKLKEVSKDNPKDNGVFDVLVANPPYSVSAFKNTLKYGEESFELFNRLTDDSSEIECLFVERTKQLLKPGGWAGVILPPSILNNSGVFVDAREIVLKYFSIKAIAEFDSNTFMATGQNTVTLFLERRANNEWKKLETAIKNFFDKPKDATVNNIEKAFSKYVDVVFNDINLQDYISLVNKKPNADICKTELFTDYKTWFTDLTEIKNLKTKKVFNDKTKDEQQIELDNLFYDKVFYKEQDKMLYFFLTYSQETVLINVGKKQNEKDFIGYEFSNRRGSEGIKMYRDSSGNLTTKLYDQNNPLSTEKANSYVYNAFLNKQTEISENLSNNISKFSLYELIDFKKIIFEKNISLNIKKKVALKSKFHFRRLGEICDVRDGTHDSPKFVQKGYPLVTSKNITSGRLDLSDVKYISEKDFIEINKRSLVEKGDIIYAMIGTVGSPVIINIEPNFAIKNVALFKFQNNKLLFNRYLKEILEFDIVKSQIEFELKGSNRSFVSLTILRNLQIPLPNLSEQKSIIKEIDSLEKERKTLFDRRSKLHESITSKFLKASSQAKNSVRLSNKNLFSVFIGNRVLKSEVTHGKGIPIYSANVFVPFGHIDKELIKDFSSPFVLWGIDGDWMVNVIHSNSPFYPTDHCGVIKVKNKDISPHYVALALKQIGEEKRFSRTFRASSGRIKEIKIDIPDKNTLLEFDKEVIKIYSKITKIESKLTSFDEQKKQILKKHLL